MNRLNNFSGRLRQNGESLRAKLEQEEQVSTSDLIERLRGSKSDADISTQASVIQEYIKRIAEVKKAELK